MTDTARDRRRHHRNDVEVNPRVDHPEWARAEICVEDVSEGGLRVSISEHVAEGDCIGFSLRDDRGTTQQLEAVVQRVSRATDGYSAGLRWITKPSHGVTFARAMTDRARAFGTRLAVTDRVKDIYED